MRDGGFWETVDEKLEAHRKWQDEEAQRLADRVWEDMFSYEALIRDRVRNSHSG